MAALSNLPSTSAATTTQASVVVHPQTANEQTVKTPSEPIQTKKEENEGPHDDNGNLAESANEDSEEQPIDEDSDSVAMLTGYNQLNLKNDLLSY